MSFNEIVFSGECLKAKKFSYTLLTSPHIIFAMISNKFRILTVYRANFRQSRFCDHDLFPQYNFFPNEKHCIFKLLILNLNRSFFTRDCFYVHSNYYSFPFNLTESIFSLVFHRQPINTYVSFFLSILCTHIIYTYDIIFIHFSSLYYVHILYIHMI